MKPGDVFDARYQLIRLLGAGGMGAVWQARELTTGRTLAIKALHQRTARNADEVTRFYREAKAALESRYSAHIIEVLEVAHPENEPPYLVMEHLEGEELAQIIRREGALPPRRAIELVIQACHAIDEVHRQGIVHRDIKPENLFVTRLSSGAEWIKLLDFGVAKFAHPLEGDTKDLTCQGCAIGTPQYMAPEQLGGETVDRRADVYSLGIVLYEALTGSHPFQEAKNFGTLVSMVLMGEIGPPRELEPSLAPSLEAVILRAVSREAQNRFPDMSTFAAALQPFLEGDATKPGLPVDMSATIPVMEALDLSGVAPDSLLPTMQFRKILLDARAEGTPESTTPPASAQERHRPITPLESQPLQVTPRERQRSAEMVKPQKLRWRTKALLLLIALSLALTVGITMAVGLSIAS